MYAVLTPDALGCPEAYPEWCDLGWFQNCRHRTSRVELHYHDRPEIYLWHEGNANALIDGRPVAMHHGVMAYTVAGAQHSITPAGKHSNTGIIPKAFSGCRRGHLHTQTTGELPKPKAPSFSLTPEENPFAAPRELPRHCFTRRVTCGRFIDTQIILKRTSESWLALLVREGKIGVRVDDHIVDVPENTLFIASQGIDLCVSSVGNSEVALAEGWPPVT